MSRVPDERRLHDMTIPGTHDTCALSRSDCPRSELGENLACQSLSLLAQLIAGIRFIDIRVGGDMTIVHVDSCGTTFREVLYTIAEFLSVFKSEGIIMRLTNCGGTGASQERMDLEMDHIQRVHFDGCHLHFVKGPRSPKDLPMGDLRGKIFVLGTGYEGRHNGFGLWACNMQDNHNSGAGGIHWAGHTKIPAIITHFNHVTTPSETDSIPAGKMSINHLSCHGFWGHHPWMFARHCNDYTLQWLRKRPRDYDYQHYGVVAADFPGPELIELCIYFNKPFKPFQAESGIVYLQDVKYGLYVHPEPGIARRGAPLVFHPGTGERRLQFQLEPAGNGCVYMKNVEHGEQYVHPESGVAREDARLVFHPGTGERRLQFELEPVGQTGSKFYLKNAQTGLYVHPRGGQAGKGVNLIFHKGGGSRRLQFFLIPAA